MSELVGTLEYRFSRVVAHLMLNFQEDSGSEYVPSPAKRTSSDESGDEDDKINQRTKHAPLETNGTIGKTTAPYAICQAASSSKDIENRTAAQGLNIATTYGAIGKPTAPHAICQAASSSENIENRTAAQGLNIVTTNGAIGKTTAPHAISQAASSSEDIENRTAAQGLNIATTNNDIKRKHDKRDYCLFCLEPQAKLKRHLKTAKKHEHEEEVIKLKAETDLKKQDIIVAKLRNIGNFLHNKDIMKKGTGQMAVKYRPKQQEAVDAFGACPYCYGYYRRKHLWRHKCPFKPEAPKTSKRKQRICQKSRVITPIPGVSSVDHILNIVLSRLRGDTISRIVKSDKTILALAKTLCKTLGEDEDEHNAVRQNLRRMGRLLQQLRLDTSADKTMLDFINPQGYKLVCKACKDMANFDQIQIDTKYHH